MQAEARTSESEMTAGAGGGLSESADAQHVIFIDKRS
jgi:hypothetical protein